MSHKLCISGILGMYFMLHRFLCLKLENCVWVTGRSWKASGMHPWGLIGILSVDVMRCLGGLHFSGGPGILPEPSKERSVALGGVSSVRTSTLSFLWFALISNNVLLRKVGNQETWFCWLENWIYSFVNCQIFWVLTVRRLSDSSEVAWIWNEYKVKQRLNFGT